MTAIYDRNLSNPLLLPEIVRLVIDNVNMVPDLLSCACVNNTWSVAALKRLYRGSLHDMRFCTPDIASLNCLFVASRERFARNMRFVKHLLLSPEIHALERVTADKIICNEKCRAMRNRQSAKLLLRPQGEGLASLTIPYEIEGQDWSLISDLLPTRTVEFLAIDNFYCKLLMASSDYLQEPMTPAFSNLKALTIYRSKGSRSEGRRGDQDINRLCQLLKSCDLQFFHLEESEGSDEILTESAIAELLSCLRRQKNLKALALKIFRYVPLLGSASTTLTDEEQGDLWPRLKMLYLGLVADKHWLEQVPKFEKLQILILQNFPFRIPTISQKAIANIAKCRHLQVIDIGYRDDIEALLDIARGCPLLRKFRVRNCVSGEPELAERVCIGLLHALPRLEHFELNFWSRMDGARLQDLARHCPRLTVLKLPGTGLCLSLAALTKAHPFLQLETMNFSAIYFEDPRRMMHRDKIRGIATEWHRVFPKLREVLCLTPWYVQKDELSEESRDSASESADEEMSPIEPRFVFDEPGSLWRELLTKLWEVHGYGKDLHIGIKIEHMWQNNLEIETVGWPVVPLMAFHEENVHSTTTRLVKRSLPLY